jgi:NAD(P)-dependent dehydrogenase (short-subunit alcohol dehydrogenase family)
VSGSGVRGCAVVVGASGSLGSAVVRRLVARGMPVVAVARSAEALQALPGEAGGDLVQPCVADIATDAAIEAIRAALPGPVDLALFCAGLPVRGSVMTIEPSLLAVGADTKIGGVIRLLRAVEGHLRPRSRFAAVAGTLGLEPGASEAGPGAINAGLINLMKQIALNLGPTGTTVHTLVPGPMDTPRLRSIAATIAEERGVDVGEVWAEYEAKVSLGRLPTVEECAWAVELLLAPEADILHGTVLHLDAGGLRGIV